MLLINFVFKIIITKFDKILEEMTAPLDVVPLPRRHAVEICSAHPEHHLEILIGQMTLEI